MEPTEPTERERYLEKLRADISKATAAKEFKESSQGKLIQELLTQEINQIVKNIGGKKYINDHNSYVYDTGQMYMAQKILNIINQNASTDTTEIADKLKAAQTDG